MWAVRKPWSFFIIGAHGEWLQAGVLLSIISFFESRSPSVAETSLKIMTLLLQPPGHKPPRSCQPWDTFFELLHVLLSCLLIPAIFFAIHCEVQGVLLNSPC